MMLLTLFLATHSLRNAALLPQRGGWSADDGNGTCSNPLFLDEFSDPDSFRVEYLNHNPDGTIQPIEQTDQGLSVPPKKP